VKEYQLLSLDFRWAAHEDVGKRVHHLLHLNFGCRV
jgi:hypothetical protein